ncbi:transcriptional regulator [Desulfococcus sp.]|uniref:HVO_A0114 family putative DNA-binding protein n=1 Tax=Desulfococcus sp. TaxID=2025834 RepID=UPI0035940EED
MRTVTLGIASRESVGKRFLEASTGSPQGTFISFDSPERLFKVLSGKRWHLLKVMTGSAPISIREAARRVGRDVKAVYADVQVLLNAGILYKTGEGRIVFPFDAIHVDFMLKAA